MKSKIHRATVTESNLHYVGSVTIDEDLISACGIFENEKVHILDVNNGNRFETYVIHGKAGSGMICINGAAARLVQPGDIVIIIAYDLFGVEEAQSFKPKIAIVDGNNKVSAVIDGELHGEV